MSSLGASSIRALIKNVGEREANKFIQSVIFSKVKSTFIRWGMTGGAKWVERGGIKLIMDGINFLPGVMIAKFWDAHYTNPNYGYLTMPKINYQL